MTENKFALRFRQGPILCAEGYLFELERRGYLQAGSFVPKVVLENPEVVLQLHREFARAGSDVMLALTYYAHRAKLCDAGLENNAEELNRQAVRLARAVAREYNLLVAGNLSNTWLYRQDSRALAKIKNLFEEQVAWLMEEGVDYFVAETFRDYGEARIALQVINKTGLPAVVTLIPFGPRTHDGLTLQQACRRLRSEGAYVVGLNCGMGPRTMKPFLRKIRRSMDGHIAALPVAYRTTPKEPTFRHLGRKQAFPDKLDPYLATRYDMAKFVKEARDMGIRYLGICCGAQPHHVRAMAEALGKKPPASEYSVDLSKHPELGKKHRTRSD